MKTKHMIRQGLLMALLVLVTLPAFSQPDGPPPRDPGKIEAFKIAFITKRLNLTPAEAQKFWPVYNEFENKRHEWQKAMAEKMKELRESSEMTEKQALEILDSEIARKQADVDQTKEFFNKLKGVIPLQKIVMLNRAERDFKEVLLKKIADRKEKKSPLR